MNYLYFFTFLILLLKKKALFFISSCERIHSAAKLFFQVFDLGRQLQLLVVFLLSLREFLLLNARGFLRLCGVNIITYDTGTKYKFDEVSFVSMDSRTISHYV